MSERCSVPTRRAALRRSGLNGLDEVEPIEGGRALLVRFFHDAPEGLAPRHLAITGGIAVRGIRVVDVRRVPAEDPDRLILAAVAVDRRGDASTYTLHLQGLDGIDPRHASAPFVFFPDAAEDEDCRAAPPAVAALPPPPPLDYLAKDYAGFRRLMLDRLAVTLPAWQDRHAPDLGVTLVEMLAAVADRLSYYQDAVATEAYLGTARRRVSVRRHLRLIDYALHEGCNARALVQVEPPDAVAELDPATLVFLQGEGAAATEFRPVTSAAPIRLCRARGQMAVHCWGDTACVLPAGATAATLVDTAPPEAPPLQPGDFLLFEVLGPGDTPDPDPRRHHPVRLTAVRPSEDPLCKRALLEVEWSAEDALPADFPLDSAKADLAKGSATTAVRGNLVLVGAGTRVMDGDAARIVPAIGPGRRRGIALARPGLAFAEPAGAADAAVRLLDWRTPGQAVPLIDRLRSWSRDPHVPPTGWTIRPDLIGSGAEDAHATVEVDDEGIAHLRFGDGVCGRDPAGEAFEIVYRVGNGPSGNVGADTITRLRIAAPGRLEDWPVRNPMPARGGTAPEPLEQARLLAPQALRGVPVRAVIAADYAALAARLDPAVQRAACRLVPSGGRQIARVAIDPLGGAEATPALCARVAAALDAVRRIGHDVQVVPAIVVPLRLVLRVELEDGYVRGHVRAAVRAALGTGVLPDGRLAAFHPDRLSFGAPLRTSVLVALVQALDGVRAVHILEFGRQFDAERGRTAAGVLAMAWNEIALLENDPLRPDRGRLVLRLAGGVA
ncbi:putative baseplate assembly protein [Dankookia rubra]|uniref:Putative baseplate assembly protein n=1 Tax=Dankookia rubra TaxID=1442381 RepID=A0A4R5QH99_9PROT|nr:putative baseplate assembly protein [Dankookia rubra]TDH62149.1 putative baseplate assembly protein [Dankookia rubra]